MAGNLFSSALGRFRVISFLEGISFILLLGIATPLKHFGNMPEATMVPGMIHGLLFVIYLIALIMSGIEMKWSFKTYILLFLASILPCGFLIAEFKFLKKQAEITSA